MTGASTGIGRASAIAFAKEGAKVRSIKGRGLYVYFKDKATVLLYLHQLAAALDVPSTMPCAQITLCSEWYDALLRRSKHANRFPSVA